MIIPEKQDVMLYIIYCPVCQKYYSEQIINMKISCCVNHAPGDCCHYGDKELTKELVMKLLKEVHK